MEWLRNAAAKAEEQARQAAKQAQDKFQVSLPRVPHPGAPDRPGQLGEGVEFLHSVRRVRASPAPRPSLVPVVS